jgi:hypothetical protein
MCKTDAKKYNAAHIFNLLLQFNIMTTTKKRFIFHADLSNFELDMSTRLEYEEEYFYKITNHDASNAIHMLIVYNMDNMRVNPTKYNNEHIIFFRLENKKIVNNIEITGAYLICNNIDSLRTEFKSQSSSFNSQGFTWFDDHEIYDKNDFEKNETKHALNTLI